VVNSLDIGNWKLTIWNSLLQASENKMRANRGVSVRKEDECQPGD